MKKEQTTPENDAIKQVYLRLQTFLSNILKEKLGPFQIGYIGTEGNQQLFVEMPKSDQQKTDEAFLVIKQSSPHLTLVKSNGFVWVSIHKSSLKKPSLLFREAVSESSDVCDETTPHDIEVGAKEVSCFIRIKRHAFVYAKINYLKDKAVAKISCSDAEEVRRIAKLFKDNHREEFLLSRPKENILYVILSGFTNPVIVAPPLVVGGRVLKPGNKVFSPATFGNKARAALPTASRWSHSYDHA